MGGRRIAAMLRRSGPIGLLLAMLLAGCGPSPTPSPAPETPKRDEAAPLQRIDRAGLEQLLLRRRGDVVLVDFWATWCLPCKELFPHTVALQRRLANRGLRVVTVSMDVPDAEAAVRKFLAGQGATTENYIAREGGTPKPFSEFQIEGGALPHLQLYDRRGTLREKISVGDTQRIDAAVERLLNET